MRGKQLTSIEKRARQVPRLNCLGTLARRGLPYLAQSARQEGRVVAHLSKLTRRGPINVSAWLLTVQRGRSAAREEDVRANQGKNKDTGRGRVKNFRFSLISLSVRKKKLRARVCSILMPPTFHIASLNRYTPKFSKLPQKLTWCQQFGVQIFPK